jgi:hypothetical protein
VAVERHDPVAGAGRLLALADRVGERPLEAHERGPVDARAARVDAAAGQPPDRVQRLGGAHQHLLRVAAAQLAGAAEGELVRDGHTPPGGPASSRDQAAARAGPDDHPIE